MKNKYLKPEIKVNVIYMDESICAGSTNTNPDLELYNKGYCRDCRFRKREVYSTKCSWCNHKLEYN